MVGTGELSQNAFLERAVRLAHKVARRLHRAVRHSRGPNPRDVTSDNVVVVVARPSTGFLPPIKTISTMSPDLRSLAVDDVRFDFGASDSTAAIPVTAQHQTEVCAVLGRILLEIFSLGQWSSPDFSNDSQIEDDVADSIEPSDAGGKRRAKSSSWTSGGLPSVAQRLLADLGMPLSIRRIVRDLLAAEGGARSGTALASLEEALHDLSCMIDDPGSFLFDRASPRAALADTGLFGGGGRRLRLTGRDEEVAALTDLQGKVSLHCRADDATSAVRGEPPFLCEVAWIGGRAGTGKSTLLRSLVRACATERWFVLGCKFDKRSGATQPAKAFDDFVGKWGVIDARSGDPAMAMSFESFCQSIYRDLDAEGIVLLCDLVPNFAKIFSPSGAKGGCGDRRNDEIYSMDKVGSAEKRRRNLFRVLFKNLCESTGRPVLFFLDDVQWSRSTSMECINDCIEYMHALSSNDGDATRRGLFVAGTYRSNEVEGSDDIDIDLIKRSKIANVTELSIFDLSPLQITELLSAKLCLPWRYTCELADLVHKKTTGNPYFINQFLRSIVDKKILQFSVRARTWTWDCDTVDMVAMADGVAELLAASFGRLPSALKKTLNIVSCLGCQVDESMIRRLDSRNEVLSFDMQSLMQLAVQENLLEKAGPVYQFSHDILHETIYEMIPPASRKRLHKIIGKALLNSIAPSRSPSPLADVSEIQLLAVDQINKSCEGGDLDPEERSQCASYNAMAAKYAMSASNFEQARAYIETGIALLQDAHWEEQYHLSLNLCNMSASISCMCGEIAEISTRLDAILSHAKSFEDSLEASSLLVKLLASKSQFDEAISNCFMVLSNLGEEFPSDITVPLCLDELSDVMKANITRESFKSASMTDKGKINAMKFMNMMCQCSIVSKPLLLPLVSCRMVKLTLKHGFCEDSIVGLALVAYSISTFKSDFKLGYSLGKLSESLINESRSKHVLQSRLCNELVIWNVLSEPGPSILARLSDLYRSAILVGDVENATWCRWNSCCMAFWSGSDNLFSLSKHLVMCTQEAEKYHHNTVYYCGMAYFNTCLHLSGETSADISMKSYADLDEIGHSTNSKFLLWQNFMNQVAFKFYMREYDEVMKLSENHQPTGQNHLLGIFLSFYQGIAALGLYRDTSRAKWRVLGEAATEIFSKLTKESRWNFEDKYKLLQAELCFATGDCECAETMYEAAIVSAKEHRILNEEALALELFGYYYIDNNRHHLGVEKLRSARENYTEWGALKKVRELQLLVDLNETIHGRSE
ncbi:hypothetical protein ACHAWF_010625 [Thalassiosira exigua]